MPHVLPRRAGLVGVTALAAASAFVIGSTTAHATATVSAPPPSPVAAGLNYELALLPNGTVRAWGGNEDGQLGNGTVSSGQLDASTVLAVSGSGALTHVVQVATGFGTSAALLADGTVVTWGSNNYLQLGNGTAVSTQDRPGYVVGPGGSGRLTGVVQIAAGADHVLALRSDGTVWAWGDGSLGALGDGHTSTESAPVQVTGLAGAAYLTGVASIAAGDETSYAVLTNGEAASWGYGARGQLGDGQTVTERTPAYVENTTGTTALTDVVEIAAGNETALAMTRSGAPLAWGSGGSGALGNANTADHDLPVAVDNLPAVTAVYSGPESDSSYAVAANGAVFGWGYNTYGQLGTGTANTDLAPARVPGLPAGSRVAGIAAGQDSTVFAAGGRTLAAGSNESGQLGDGTEVGSTVPVSASSVGAPGLPRLVELAAPVLGGHARVGYSLTVTHGAWGLPATAYAYQWYRDGKAIRGATSAAHRVTTADERHRIAARVVATRAGYPAGVVTTRTVTIPA